MIADSWRRSKDYGLRETDRPDFTPLSPSQLATTLERNHALYIHALPVMETLCEQIINTHSMVALTDANGLILHRLGDDDFLAKANDVALRPGVSWSEQSKGTNAVGTALTTGQPTLVHASEHFLSVNQYLTCSCVPLLDPHGGVIGALDVTGDHLSYQPHTLALVRMSAQMIENHLFDSAFPDAIRVHFHARPEFIGTLMEGIIAFRVDGTFLAANRSAQFQLGGQLGVLRNHTFSSLFGMSVPELFDHYRMANPSMLRFSLPHGVVVHARADLRNAPALFGGATVARTAAEATSGTRTANKPGGRLSSLRYLDTGDAKVASVIAKVRKVNGQDIPILILGETGTGKELLAQAIHNDSPRWQAPFVAVNCASIPETLIESELFGYEGGAFTGARSKGTVGKVVQANGGTLFLDEIGDMPMSLQARLLRVLQERSVTPLGGSKEIPVNIGVVCATNKNLRELIARGEFREDLYYRLNGLVVRLPPLRERTDLDVVILKMIAAECKDRIPLQLAPEVADAFQRYRWPGNFRQLGNLLRTACVMAGDEDAIRMEHLPDDFLDDLETLPPEPLMPEPPAAPRQASAAAAPQRLEDVEASVIAEALRAHGGNVSAAARALGISRNTIYRKL